MRFTIATLAESFNSTAEKVFGETPDPDHSD